jgi:hypothetical protein
MLPGEVEPTLITQHGHEVIIPALSDHDWDEAVCTAQTEYNCHRLDRRIVGCSIRAVPIIGGRADIHGAKNKLPARERREYGRRNGSSIPPKFNLSARSFVRSGSINYRSPSSFGSRAQL